MAPIPTYPPYNKPSVAPSPVVQPHRELLALLRPPAATAPAPPARPALAPPPAGYTRTLHAAPAAWPKTLKESEGTYERLSQPFGPVPDKESKEERAARIERETELSTQGWKASHHWSIEEARKSSQPAQWLAVERWRRDEQDKDGVTLVLAHANGLQKELWFPMVRRLLEHNDAGALFGSGAPLRSKANVVVNDIWFLDDAHHGASVDVNAKKLGRVYAWADCARDTLNFVQHVLPSVNGDAYQLAWAEARPAPPVIGVGHSIGGNAMVRACRAAPERFSSIFLVEPMCQPAIGAWQRKATIVQGAFKRRSNWPDVAEAAKSRTNPMFKTWDGEVFDLYLKTSLVPTGNREEVTLATPSWAEGAIFSDPEGPQRGWDALPDVKCPVGFVLGADPTWLGGPKVVPEIPWRAPRSRNERVMEGGHLLPQEAPTQCADAMWRFLATIKAGEWDQSNSKL